MLLTKKKYLANKQIAVDLFIDQFGGEYRKMPTGRHVILNGKEIKVAASMDLKGYMLGDVTKEEKEGLKEGITPAYMDEIDSYAVLREYPDGRLFWYMVSDIDAVKSLFLSMEQMRIDWDKFLWLGKAIKLEK